MISGVSARKCASARLAQSRGGSVSVIKVGFGYRLFLKSVQLFVSVGEITDLCGYFSVIAKL